MTGAHCFGNDGCCFVGILSHSGVDNFNAQLSTVKSCPDSILGFTCGVENCLQKKLCTVCKLLLDFHLCSLN